MSGILSIIVAVVMALSGITAAMTDTVSVEAKLDLNRDAILSMIPETTTGNEAGEAAQSVDPKAMILLGADVLNGLSFRGTADSQTLELELAKDGKTLISAGVQMDQNGVVVASNLLGGQVLNLSGETISKIMEEMANASQGEDANNPMSGIMQTLQNIDFQKLSEELTTVMGKAMAEVQGKIGEPESGKFEVDGTEYTVKTPVNITDQELAMLSLTIAKDLLAMESIQPVLQMLPEGTNLAAEIDKKIEEISNLTPENRFDTEIATYTNEAGGSWLSFDASRQSVDPKMTAHLGLGQEDAENSGMSLKVNVAENVDLDLAFEMNADGTGMMVGNISTPGETGSNAMIIVAGDATGVTGEVTVVSMGKTVHVQVEENFADEMVTYSLHVQMDGVDGDILALEAYAGPGGEIKSTFSGDDLSVIKMEDLFSEDSEVQQQASGALMTGFMGGFMSAISTLISSVPAETGEMLSNMIGPMMGMPAQ